MYVAVEGIEGAGKTTVADGLATHWASRGHDVVRVREPGGTPTGEGIRDLLLHGPDLAAWTEALLFAAQRAQLAAEVIRPALAGGAIVVGDRSVYSSLAYQGAGRDLGVEEVGIVNRAGLGGTWPDVVVLLRVDPVVGLDRQKVADRIGREGRSFAARVAAAFDALAAAEPDRFVVVDVDGLGAEAVIDRVVAALGDRR